jgi:hypothetical protein
MKTQASDDDEKLYGWESIASYLGCSAKTARKRERENALPVHLDGGGPERRRVIAYARELDAWRQQQQEALPPTPEAPARSAPTDEVSATRSFPVQEPKRRSLARLWIFLFLLLFVGLLCVWRMQPVPELRNFRQITANNLEKSGIVSSGQMLYFGQEYHGHLALTTIPVTGGSYRTLWAPAMNVTPVSASKDDNFLLALTAVSTEDEQQVWMAPLHTGSPYRLGSLTAHAAALSPDGQTVALATGNRIVLSNLSGSNVHVVATFAGMASDLIWSSDGNSLRCFLLNSQQEKISGWAEITGKHWHKVATHPLSTSFEAILANALLPGGADLLTAADADGRKNAAITWLHFGGFWWSRALRITPLQNMLGFVSGLCYAPSPSRVFFLLQQKQRESVLRFDAGTQRFTPVLPGTDAIDLDYSRDGQWLAYSALPDRSLWISRADGKEKKQIVAAPNIVELPRWSPDGRQLAFTMKSPNRPWRIYVVDRNTGAMHEAVQGNDSQGGPSWTPDGRLLFYGNVHCEYLHNCAVHRIDLIAGTTEMVQGSENLFTARVSPDGTYLAALHVESHQIMLYECASGHWRALGPTIHGTDLSWASDSQTLYASDLGTNAGIVAIRVRDGQRRTAVDMHAIDQLDLATPQDLKFSLAPDNAVLLRHRTSPYEIYSYDLQNRFSF